jgi:hypothetical protein
MLVPTSEDFVFNPLHYLALLERKIGALDQAAPLVGWELPEELPPSPAAGTGKPEGSAAAGAVERERRTVERSASVPEIRRSAG